MERLFTVGAYGFDAKGFFDALQEARVDLFLDLRYRRGMRGRQYSFANARRLQQELEVRNMAYRHVIELAPDPGTRELQQRQDMLDRVAKRQRVVLGEAFIAAYSQRTLAPFDWDTLAKELSAFQRPVAFCVEEASEACHRSLAAHRMAVVMRVPVEDLLP